MNVSEIDDENLVDLLLRLNATKQVTSLSVEKCMEELGEDYNHIPKTGVTTLNITCLEHAPIFDQSALVKASVLLFLAVFSILGNVLTMYSIRKSRKRHKGHIYNLLYNLAIADLCVTFWCIIGDAVWYLTVEWKLGNFECKLFKFVQMFSLYLSTFIMVLIGVDRFIAIKYPMKSLSNKTCFKLILFCWALSAVLSFPQMVVFTVQSGPFQEPFFQCVTYGSYSSDWQEQLYTLFTVAFTFILPLSILATTYLLTFCALHRNEEIMDHTGTFRTLINPNRRKIIRRAKMKSLRISVAIVVAFIICWTPYYLAMLHTFGTRINGQDLEDPDNILFTIVFFFGVSNSLCNPIIYGVFHLWKPRRKELQRANSSRRSLFGTISFPRRRSTMLIHENGVAIADQDKINECRHPTKLRSHNNSVNGETPIVKALIKWKQNGNNVSI